MYDDDDDDDYHNDVYDDDDDDDYDIERWWWWWWWWCPMEYYGFAFFWLLLQYFCWYLKTKIIMWCQRGISWMLFVAVNDANDDTWCCDILYGFLLRMPSPSLLPCLTLFVVMPIAAMPRCHYIVNMDVFFFFFFSLFFLFSFFSLFLICFFERWPKRNEKQIQPFSTTTYTKSTQ